MAHAVPNGPDSHADRFSETVGKLLASKATLPAAAAVLAVVLLLFAYALRGYLDADCYAAMHEAQLDQETSALFEDVGVTMVALRKGTGGTARWSDAEFQERMQEALGVAADGRRALKEQDAFAALDAILELEKVIAQAKSRATARVNFILSHQDPRDYDGFEKYRLEGANLVAIVKTLDGALETLDGRTKRLPKACSW